MVPTRPQLASFEQYSCPRYPGGSYGLKTGPFPFYQARLVPLGILGGEMDKRKG